MFKLTGILLLMISVFIFFYRTSLTDRFTYIFLEQTAEIFRILQFENISLRTYPDIFRDMNMDKLLLYKDFDFYKRNSFFTDLAAGKLIDTDEISKVKGMFSQLGYRNTEQEKLYISQCTNNLQQKADYYKTKYAHNSKTNRMCGLSVGIVIMIMCF